VLSRAGGQPLARLRSGGGAWATLRRRSRGQCHRWPPSPGELAPRLRPAGSSLPGAFQELGTSLASGERPAAVSGVRERLRVVPATVSTKSSDKAAAGAQMAPTAVCRSLAWRRLAPAGSPASGCSLGPALRSGPKCCSPSGGLSQKRKHRRRSWSLAGLRQTRLDRQQMRAWPANDKRLMSADPSRCSGRSGHCNQTQRTLRTGQRRAHFAAGNHLEPARQLPALCWRPSGVPAERLCLFLSKCNYFSPARFVCFSLG